MEELNWIWKTEKKKIIIIESQKESLDRIVTGNVKKKIKKKNLIGNLNEIVSFA